MLELRVKGIIAVALCIGLFLPLRGYSQTIEWAKCFGWTEANDENISKIIESKDGNYDVLMNKALFSATSGVTLTKINQKGFVLWETIIQSTQVNGFKGVDFVQLPDSTYYVLIQSPNTQQYCVNTSKGVRYFTIPYMGWRGYADFLLIKLNSKGEQLWYKFYGGSFDDEPKKILFTKTNQLILAGNTYSGDGDLVGCGRRYGSEWSKDNWVFKADTSGNIIWKKCYGGTSHEEFYDITETTNGDFLICGKTTSNDSYIYPNRGGYDAYLIRISASGTEFWSKTYGGSDLDEAKKVIELNNGDIILGSTTLSNSHDLLNKLHQAGYEDIWLARLNVTGTIQWDRAYGGSFKEKLNDLILRNENLVIIGSTGSTNGDVGAGFHAPTGVNYNALDDWSFEVNPSGTIQWQRIMGGNNYEESKAGLLTKDDYLLIGGQTNTDNNGDINQFWGGSYADALMYKLKIPCQENFISNNTQSGTVNIGANNTIQFSGIVAEQAKVKHNAGKIIMLEAGTLISNTSTYEAKILPCPSATIFQATKPINTQIFQECRENGVKFKFEPFTEDSTIKKFLLSIEDNDSQLPYTYSSNYFIAHNNVPNNSRHANFKVNLSKDNYKFEVFVAGSTTCQHDSNPTDCPENNRQLLIDKKVYALNDIINVTWTGTLQSCSTHLQWTGQNIQILSSNNSTMQAKIIGFPVRIQAQPSANYAGCYICHGWTILELRN